jgi:hypothetical protein
VAKEGSWASSMFRRRIEDSAVELNTKREFALKREINSRSDFRLAKYLLPVDEA